MKSFVEAQFGYCPLALICLSREVNRTSNHIHERSLSVTTPLSVTEITIVRSRIYLGRISLHSRSKYAVFGN